MASLEICVSMNYDALRGIYAWNYAPMIFVVKSAQKTDVLCDFPIWNCDVNHDVNRDDVPTMNCVVKNVPIVSCVLNFAVLRSSYICPVVI